MERMTQHGTQDEMSNSHHLAQSRYFKLLQVSLVTWPRAATSLGCPKRGGKSSRIYPCSTPESRSMPGDSLLDGGKGQV
eukprot:scaffold1883_cov261-Pinguiococcus_pyrenoidosus.AAC.19